MTRRSGVARAAEAAPGMGFLPAETRPRERLLEGGPDRLSEVELLALVLGSAGRLPAVRAAEDLLRRYGGPGELSRLPARELSRGGIGEARAARLAAALELGRRAQTPRLRELALATPSDVYRWARPRLGHLTREVFHVLLLDARHRIVADRRVAEGGLSSCAISPRDVYEPAIREAAPAVIFVHNHPSGDPTPSRDDVALTRRLKEAGAVLGVTLVDHVVVADGGYVSLLEAGKL
jgi:DNA repair protein RadC